MTSTLPSSRGSSQIRSDLFPRALAVSDGAGVETTEIPFHDRATENAMKFSRLFPPSRSAYLKERKKGTVVQWFF